MDANIFESQMNTLLSVLEIELCMHLKVHSVVVVLLLGFVAQGVDFMPEEKHHMWLLACLLEI